MAVVAILGLLAGVAITRFGSGSVAAVSAEGLARNLALTLNVARQQAIAEGGRAAVVLNRDAGQVVSARLVRVTAGVDTPTDDTLTVPDGVTLTSVEDRWEFDFTGSLLTPAAGGTLTLTQGVWTYTLSVNAVTGRVSFDRTN